MRRGIPRLAFLIGEGTNGPPAMFRDLEFGERQERFRAQLGNSGITTATVTTPDQLETVLLQALNTVAHDRAGDLGSAVSTTTSPGTTDGLPGDVADLLPETLRRRLSRAADCRNAVVDLVVDARESPSGTSVVERFRRVLALAVAIAGSEAWRTLSARDALLLCAVARHVAADHTDPPTLRSTIRHDTKLRQSWISFVHNLDSMSPAAWQERVGDAGPDNPHARDLEALPDELGASELIGFRIFVEQHRVQLTAATARAKPSDTIVPSAVGSFPEFSDVLGALLTTLDEPPDAFAVRCADLLGGAKSVAGCRVLYIGVLLRAALSFQRLVEVADDETLRPVRTFEAVDHRLTRLQGAVKDVRPLSEEQGEALHLICDPTSPRLLEDLRTEIGALRDAVAGCAVVLARSYRLGVEAVFRLRYELVRSNVDDAGRYVEEADLPFEPELGQLTLRASGVLPLFVRPLYGYRPEVGVRELLQNALDAVWARSAFERADGSAAAENTEPIRISLSDRTGPATTLLRSAVPPPPEWHHWIEVRDAGVGMTPQIVREHFLTVGGSFDPVEDLARRTGPGRPQRRRIGRFGVGVCAAFLLGSEVQVITRHVTAADSRATCMRFIERDDATELYRCTAPVGTTVRVRLDEGTYQQLTSDLDRWDWFIRSDPMVVRASVHDGKVDPVASVLQELLNRGEVRQLSVPPYGTVRWTPSSESYMSHLFVNGVRIVSLHRNHDRNILKPVEQLKQCVIDIDDSTGATDLLLTRDGFASLPEPVFAAVCRDAVADHLAWMVRVATAGPDRSLPQESPLWEERYYTMGQGDGVIRAMPFVVAGNGLVPLDRGLLAQAGITEVTFVLVGARSDMTPFTAAGLMTAVRPEAGAAVGVMQVNMMGGFGYSTVAAGIIEAFQYGQRLGETTQAQLVTSELGDAYAKMDRSDVVARWGNSMLFRRTSPRNYSSPSQSEEQRLKAEVARDSDGVRIDGLLATLDEPGSPTSGRLLRRVVALHGYGLLHVWLAGLDDEPVSPPDRSELQEAWRRYRLPPVLSLAVPTRIDTTPLAADMQQRLERVRRENAEIQPIRGPVPG